MKKILYDDQTIEIFKILKSNSPKRMLSDEFMQVAFDYGNFYFIASPEDFIAASQNTNDEAIIVKFEKHNEAYKIHESEKVLFENPKISNIYILRTLLYFSDHINYKDRDEAISVMTKEEKENEILSDVLSKATGGHEEIVCHPQSDEAEKVNKDFSNLVDAGILIEVNGEKLLCFSYFNSFSANGQTWTNKEIEEDLLPFYEFIKVI